MEMEERKKEKEIGAFVARTTVWREVPAVHSSFFPCFFVATNILSERDFETHRRYRNRV